ncbi:hypothetical protein D9619_006386 [Psilocybe cf. subviscida]|uniref:Uncharacterized protein n=1 Tax=Psilocybe cf. subviscida TaxID=2480587 RepID=A0A8H5B4A7_9AGAR|nr:hypothetical protein D9619_006386 [Psilocybe cf. subviscida]
MNPSEVSCYPRSYYADIAFFCANHMTRIFSPDPMMSIFLFDQHNGWQSHLKACIERVLLRARFEDSVAIGALVLVEKFRDSAWPKHPYPDDVYLGYFVAAYTLAHRALSRTRRPMREGFWADVFADVSSPKEIPNVTRTFVRALNYDTKISKGHFVEMRSCMYTFIRTHMTMRSGKRYERSREAVLPASPPKVFVLPPCCEEIVRRRCRSGHSSIDNSSDEGNLVPEDTNMCYMKITDRRSYDALFRSNFTSIA